MNKNILLYYNEDKTAFGVLVSYNFGASWGTWSEQEFAYDRRVIEFWMAHKDDKSWMDTVTIPYIGIESVTHAEAREFLSTNSVLMNVLIWAVLRIAPLNGCP